LQNEAHTASINLQRHALDTSAYTARIAQLEGENKLLRAELGVLRDNPAPPPSSSLQSGAPSSVFSSAFASSSTASAEEAREKERETVAELTLALRALSAKHTLALASLSTATQALTDATLRTRQAEHTADEAYALAARRRAREAELEDALRERGEEVERAREEARRSDAVVREYAGLVRRLEGRSPAAGRTSFALGHTRGVSGSGSVDAGSTPTLVEPASPFAPAPAATDADAKPKSTSDLEAGPTDALDWEKRGAELTASCTKLELALAASHTLVAELGTELARAKYEREVARIEDSGAGAVVERYMCVCVESLPVSPTTTTTMAFSRFGGVFGVVAGRRRLWSWVLLAAVLACFRFRLSRRRAARLWYALCRSVRSFSFSFPFSFYPAHMHRRVLLGAILLRVACLVVSSRYIPISLSSAALPPSRPPAHPLTLTLTPHPVHRKFTQQTTTALHNALAALRARHGATLATLHATIGSLEVRLGAREAEVRFWLLLVPSVSSPLLFMCICAYLAFFLMRRLARSFAV
jgi:hypothetical protein